MGPDRIVDAKQQAMSNERPSKAGQAVSISMASQITNVEVHTLRYWEREFEQFLSPERTPGGQRRYRPEDIQTVFTIKRLLRDEMFSIAGARRTLQKRRESAA
ncbi:MAG: MerR family transcriptional regulator [Fimbriimonas ginsengisoli]|uniref:MerR family transcriptional regulator n=1 Tax=Fimbriimonas ginsengisoli TaxID=1005039 RepID=A0A931PWF1_FIMGI|nr:MerR family transcriptional regulator [Fimbriimonas ginsengisoli]